MSYVTRLESPGGGTIANPGTLQTGDLLLVLYAARGFVEANLPAGWSLIDSAPAPELRDEFGAEYRHYLVGCIADTTVLGASGWTFPGDGAAVMYDHRLAGWAYRGEQSVWWRTALSDYPELTATTLEHGASGALTRMVRLLNTTTHPSYRFHSTGTTRYEDEVPSSSTAVSQSIFQRLTYSSEESPWVIVYTVDVDSPDRYRAHTITVSTDPASPRSHMLTPSGAFLNSMTSQIPVTWSYHPGLCRSQAAYVLKVEVDSVTSYWNATTNLLQATPVENLSTTHGSAIFAGAIPLGKTVRLSVATRGQLGVLGPLGSTVTFYTAAKPSATVSIAGLSGSTVADMTPTIIPGGAPSSTVGGLYITGYQAKVTLGATEVATWAGNASLPPWTLLAPLDNGTTYTAHVRVVDSAGSWSDWATMPFTVQVETMGAPTLSATLTTDPTSSVPGISIAGDFSLGTFDWSHIPVAVRLERLEGTTWLPVALTAEYTARLHWALYDYYAPAGTHTYRMRGEGRTSEGGRIIGPWASVTAPSFSPPPGWLVPYGAPERALVVFMIADESRSVSVGREGHTPLGSMWATVSGGSPSHEPSALKLRTSNRSSRDALVALLTEGWLLMLRQAPERDPMSELWDPQYLLWHRAVGKVSVARAAQGPHAHREMTYGFELQPAPWEE